MINIAIPTGIPEAFEYEKINIEIINKEILNN